jgi:predicted DNA-binding transcriptional regulator AlpA
MTSQTMAHQTERLLTPEEVAEWLAISVGTLKNWRIAGEGPPFVRLGSSPKSSTRYRRVDVESWLSEGQ